MQLSVMVSHEEYNQKFIKILKTLLNLLVLPMPSVQKHRGHWEYKKVTLKDTEFQYQNNWFILNQ